MHYIRSAHFKYRNPNVVSLNNYSVGDCLHPHSIRMYQKSEANKPLYLVCIVLFSPSACFICLNSIKQFRLLAFGFNSVCLYRIMVIIIHLLCPERHSLLPVLRVFGFVYINSTDTAKHIVLMLFLERSWINERN